MRSSRPSLCGSPPEAPTQPLNRPRHIRARYRRLGLGFGLFLVGSTLSSQPGNTTDRDPLTAPKLAARSPAASTMASTGWNRTGPWGQLHINRIRLVQRDEILAQLVVHPGHFWSFGHQTWSEVDAFLDTLPLPPAVRATLADPGRRTIDLTYGENVIVVPDALRLDLDPAVRTRLYRHMATVGSSPAHQLPFIVPDDPAIDAARLDPATAQRLRRLLFVHGSLRRLADFDLMLASAKDETERAALRRLVLSAPSLTVELTRASLSDRESVIAYWSRPKSTSAQRWLRLFDRSPDMASIDLAQILPALPRRLVNTYPDGQSTPPDANCFWTALNFYRNESNDDLLPLFEDIDRCAELAQEELDRHYEAVEAPYRYGDVLVFRNRADGKDVLTHAVVYLAADIVLTKNGWGATSPFSLSLLPEVIESYDWATHFELSAFRPKPGSPALPSP